MKTRKIALVVGGRDSGKTSYLEAVLHRARTLGKRGGGVLNHGIRALHEKTGFMLEVVATGDQYFLADNHRHSDTEIASGSFFFSPRTFEIAVEALKASSGADVIVVDEFGPLEKMGQGLWPGIEYLLHHHPGCLVISVRPRLLADLQKILHSAFANDPSNVMVLHRTTSITDGEKK
jgi:nucleoside-triphosphatase THEP1